MAETTLVVGGTSGLGLEVARARTAEGPVFVTGRDHPGKHPDYTADDRDDDIEFYHLNLSPSRGLPGRVGSVVMQLPDIDMFVYAAGQSQQSSLVELDIAQVDAPLDVGIRGLAHMTRALLLRQETLDNLVVVTSTSQLIPREREPMYAASKAAMAHFAHSMSLSDSIGRVLVVGPSGMDTAFWPEEEREARRASGYLDPRWVAQTIAGLLEDVRNAGSKYGFAKILGGADGPRVEDFVMDEPPKVEG